MSNTSPILNLAIVGRLSLLHEQLGEVLIPRAVADELRWEEELPGSEAIRAAVAAGWLRVEETQATAILQLLARELDRGEAEAIALAVERRAERLLLDEREGRKAAKSLGLAVTGVLGILLRAHQEGQLPALRPVLEELVTQAGFRIRSDLFARLVAFDDLGPRGP